MRTGRLAVSKNDHLAYLEDFFDDYAAHVTQWHQKNAGYHKSIASLASFYIPPGSRVLEVGSGNGDLLGALNPSYGFGIDISGEMTKLAASRYPEIQFAQMAAEELDLPGEQFDFIVLSDLVGYLYDIRYVFERLRPVCHSRTRLVIHWYSKLWEPFLNFLVTLGLKHPQPIVNWTSVEDLYNLLYLANHEVISYRAHILLPKQVPIVTAFVNRYLRIYPCFACSVLRTGSLPGHYRFHWKNPPSPSR